MIIKFTNREMNNPLFAETLTKLIKCDEISNRGKLRVSEIAKQVDVLMRGPIKDYQDLAKKFCEVDEKGEVIGFPEPEKMKYKTPESRGFFVKGFQEILDKPVKVSAKKISIEDLKEAKLDINEIASISCLIAD